MAGPIEASITASINKKDMDVSFEIYELTADGKYFYLMSNYQRASLAKDPTQRNLLTEGKIETFQFNHDYMTCNQMEAGSRIVVVFGINKNFNWQVNYGTGKDVSEETILDAEVPMEIKWYNSSFIQVPILR
jgi:predicted acyl esterase